MRKSNHVNATKSSVLASTRGVEPTRVTGSPDIPKNRAMSWRKMQSQHKSRSDHVMQESGNRKSIPVVGHKAFAEVSIIGDYRRGELL